MFKISFALFSIMIILASSLTKANENEATTMPVTTHHGRPPHHPSRCSVIMNSKVCDTQKGCLWCNSKCRHASDDFHCCGNKESTRQAWCTKEQSCCTSQQVPGPIQGTPVCYNPKTESCCDGMTPQACPYHNRDGNHTCCVGGAYGSQFCGLTIKCGGTTCCKMFCYNDQCMPPPAAQLPRFRQP